MNTAFYDLKFNDDKNINRNNQSVSLKHNKRDIYNNYYLSIRDNNTGIFKEIYLTESEFNVIKTAIKYNNGIINLLGHKEEVNNLYRKGLIEISNDELEVLVVSDLILKLLSPKVLENRNILLSYNKDIHSNNKYKNSNNIIKNAINNLKNIFNCNNTNNTNNTEEGNIELDINQELNISNYNKNNYNKNNNSITSISSINFNSLFDGNEDEYLLEENRPNSIFKIFDNLDVCFCCLL